MEPLDLIIIGAGVTGLASARIALEGAPERKVLILEKSAGVGGRLATRRSPPAIFDHGAQTYPVQASAPWHEVWKRSGRIDEWIDAQGVKVGSSRAGMTDLAKHLAQGLDVRKNTRVIRVEPAGTLSWNVVSETGERWESKRVLLTAPAPQALELLSNSGIAFPSGLSQLTYDPALVLLLGLDASPNPPTPFLNPLDPPLLAVTDQEQKKVSGTAAWTVLFDPAFSATHFDADEAVVKALALKEVNQQFPDLRVRDSQLKKWRYSRSRKVWNEPAFKMAGHPGLVLAGDAFGGDGIDGALRSAKTAVSLLF